MIKVGIKGLDFVTNNFIESAREDSRQHESKTTCIDESTGDLAYVCFRSIKLPTHPMYLPNVYLWRIAHCSSY